MPTFGSFETDKEVYSGPSYIVYSARKAGDPAVEYAVKVFSLHRTSLDTESASELDPLLTDIETARVGTIALQQAAAAGSKLIAPIIESGRDERGVWYATRFYPRSVNKIISGRVALSRDALEHIILAITRGALDIKRICGRSHGDIQPSNIQISRSEKLVEAEVVLSDPMPGEATAAEEYERSDLRSIGRILLQLVLRREIHHADDFLVILPILSSPEWKRLFGKQADHWLSLCNRLLDPNLSLDRLSLDQLIGELESLRSKPPLSHRATIAVAALAVLLGVASVFAVRYFKRGNLLITTDPPGAEITLEANGELRSFGKTPLDKTPLSIKSLPKGEYTVRAEYSGLTGQTNVVAVEAGKTRSYPLSFPYGVVRITSEPANAVVELEGQTVGSTPYTSPFLPPGQRNYNIRLPNHEPAKAPVVIPSNRQVISIERTLVRMRAGDGLVEFSSVPLGATIREGNNVLGEAPVAKSLSPGPHTITAQYQNWPSISTNIVVAAGENGPVEFRPPHGVARFDVTPADSEIFLNGVSMGRDVRRKALQPLEYTLVVTHAGYEPFTNRITIADRLTTNILVSLKAMLGFVEFTTVPPGAAIFDARTPDRELGRTQPGQPLKRSFQPGSYSFIARYPGLDEVRSKRLEISMGANLTLSFPFEHSTVQFDTEPDGADVLIARKEMGKTPYTYYQKPGPVAYRVQLEDYYPEEGARELALGATTPVSVRLRRLDVPITLRSDPPGARFYQTDNPLPGTNDLYSMPWGTNRMIARHPLYRSLGELNTSVVAAKRGQNLHEFQFDYGTVILTNLPEEIIIKEGNDELPVVPGPVRMAYERPGSHNYELFDGDEKVTNLTVRVESRLNTTVPAGLVGEVGGIRNSIGMRLVKVRNLLGPGNDAWVGKYEVTQREYQLVMGNNPSAHPLGDNYPVENVNWDQAMEFCRKLKASDEKKPPVRGGYNYNLPTREQWLFFAEGARSQDAVLRANAPSPVGSKPANAKRLHDVLGNVWEWLADTDGVNSKYIGAAYNIRYGPFLEFGATDQRSRTFVGAEVGFRVVLVPATPAASAAGR